MSWAHSDGTTTGIGTLYVVGTPIGNLGDMTLRAIETLKTVDLIAAEDTRHTGKLLKHFGITTPQTPYHHHNRHHQASVLRDRVLGGLNLALVSDAGMPGISDPGYELVQACVTAHIPVVPIPGVTAAITALAVSGLPSESFEFIGFLPTKKKPRIAQLQRLATLSHTLILYEAPHRLLTTLRDLSDSGGGDRAIVIARELTKLHESFWRGTVAAACAHFEQQSPKGEFTLILGGTVASELEWSTAQLQAQLSELISQGLSRSAASRQLADRTQLPRRQLYQLSLQLPDECDEAPPDNDSNH